MRDPGYLTLLARELLIVMAMGIVVFGLYIACKPFGRNQRLKNLHNYEALWITALTVSGFMTSYHLGMHGGLFRCMFPNCKAQASIWLAGYCIVLATWPVAAKLLRRPHTLGVNASWIIFGLSYWVVCYATGKALWRYIHAWVLT